MKHQGERECDLLKNWIIFSEMEKPNVDDRSVFLQKFEAEKYSQFQEILNFHRKELAENRLKFDGEKLTLEEEIGKRKAKLSEASLNEQRIKSRFSLIEKEKQHLKRKTQIMKIDIDSLMKFKIETTTKVPNRNSHMLEEQLASANKAFQKMKRKNEKVKRSKDDFREKFLSIAQSVHNQVVKTENQLLQQLSLVENI